MIISEKCNCCVHDEICLFKDEYVSACEAIKECCFVGKGVKYVKDSNIDVHIRCPHMMTQSATRKGE